MVKHANRKARNSDKTTGPIVLSAIKKLTKNTGWTARTIVKFVKMDYAVPDVNISRKISKALRSGVRLGLLQMERGRYRLNHNVSSLAKPVKTQDVRGEQKQTDTKERPLRIRSKSPKSGSRLVILDETQDAKGEEKRTPPKEGPLQFRCRSPESRNDGRNN